MGLAHGAPQVLLPMADSNLADVPAVNTTFLQQLTKLGACSSTATTATPVAAPSSTTTGVVGAITDPVRALLHQLLALLQVASLSIPLYSRLARPSLVCVLLRPRSRCPPPAEPQCTHVSAGPTVLYTNGVSINFQNYESNGLSGSC